MIEESAGFSGTMEEFLLTNQSSMSLGSATKFIGEEEFNPLSSIEFAPRFDSRRLIHKLLLAKVATLQELNEYYTLEEGLDLIAALDLKSYCEEEYHRYQEEKNGRK